MANEMANEADRMKVLGMLDRGEIDADRAVQLLGSDDAALVGAQVPAPRATPEIDVTSARSGTPRWIRIAVHDAATGKRRVNVRVPYALVLGALRIGARFASLSEIEEIRAALEAQDAGKLVEVLDDEGGDHVVISLE